MKSYGIRVGNAYRRNGTVVRCVVAALALAWAGSPLLGQQLDWITFIDVSHILIDPNSPVGVVDSFEKDIATGDLDGDGDTDLVIVRKIRGSDPGGLRDVLFMNEGGFMMDRTAELAPRMLEWVNDRDVVIADVTEDGNPDVITATTFGDRPRIYVNLGCCDVACDPSLPCSEDPGLCGDPANPRPFWCGLNYDESENRIPAFSSANCPATCEPICAPDCAPNCQPSCQPICPGDCPPNCPPGCPAICAEDCPPNKFCGVAVGDVNRDEIPDLYFVDYKFETHERLFDRLLINDGTGHFTDETVANMNPAMFQSSFGTGVAMADMDGDGNNDIVKSDATTGTVSIIYNSAFPNTGDFKVRNEIQEIILSGTYMVAVGDLDNSQGADMYFVNDGDDKYYMNDGTGGFEARDILFGPSTGVPGGNVGFANLDNNEFLDVLVSDFDVNLDNCENRLALLQNQANEMSMDLCDTVTHAREWKTKGTFDTAVFDLAPGFKALWSGTCDGNRLFAQNGVAELADCNSNGIFDLCEINHGAVEDCNGDGVPDECHGCSCVYDDVCEFRICEGSSQCQITPAAYGDMAGPGGTCGPDGDVTLPDVLSVLDAFSGIFSGCCTLENHDITGNVDICTPDGVIDIRDINAVNNAFSGMDPCCAQGFAQGGGSGGLAGSGGEAVLILVPRQENTQAGGLFEIDIFVADVNDLRGYQLAMEIDATAASNVTLEAITIDEQRTDHVFAGLEYQHAIDLANSRMVASLPQGGATPQGQTYLATFAFRLSPEARGMSVVRVLRGGASMMLDSAGRSMELLGSADATISIP